MTKVKLLACLLGIVLAAPCWADTYYGGFEDIYGARGTGSDYDYNDIVFQITGVTLNAPGASWFGKPVLQSTLFGQAPFWNNASWDGTNKNIGYCIYNGCTDPGGGSMAAVDPTASYLAANASSTGSANNVTFSAAAGVGGQVYLEITADTDVLGWALTSSPGTIHWLNPGGTTGAFSFTPGGTFEFVGNNNNGSGGSTYYSKITDGNGGDTSGVSHFAYFGNPVPEPASIFGLGTVLFLVGFKLRRKRT